MKVESGKRAIVKLRRCVKSTNGWIIWKKAFILGILISGFLGMSQAVQSQEYPTQPITMLISNAPGAGTDVCSRVIAQGASKILGQEIIPIEPSRAGGAVAVAVLVSSKADGYTLSGTTDGPLLYIPHLESVHYDLKDFTPIIQYEAYQDGLAVRSDSPWKTLQEFIDYAKNNPGKIKYASSGAGTPEHLIMEVMSSESSSLALATPQFSISGC
jgi:tripartite-type tricarboxylate transporter receptor subunit TctC